MLNSTYNATQNQYVSSRPILMSMNLMLQVLKFFNIACMADRVILCNFLLWYFVQKCSDIYLWQWQIYTRLKRIPIELIPDHFFPPVMMKFGSDFPSTNQEPEEINTQQVDE